MGTDDLIGKVMVIQCANSGIGGYMPADIACAPITEYTAVATPSPVTPDPTKQYVATFDKLNSGIGGSVTVNDGQIIVDLDLSDEPMLPGGFATCLADGLKYHIHAKWTHTDNNDRSDTSSSTTCGSTYTGGHYDPWNACGGASGSAYC